jgi:nucleotide-binding universal stress UspA family protein
MIQRILVPIDFSDGSAAALRYAEALGETIGVSEVRVIHVFTPQTVPADTVVAAPVGELMDTRERDLSDFLRQYPAPAGIRRRSELLLGFPADKIVSESKRTDLVVMGATGETDLLEEVFGTVASEVTRRAECPVLLVPQRATFSNYRHILYGSSSLSLSRRAVLQLMEFNDLFRARIHFVHVNEDGDGDRREREKLFAPLFNNPDPEFAFEIVEVTAGTVQEGLTNYLRNNQVQLAVMVTEHRGFWQRLFHHSETKQMVFHPEVPVLVLHLE